MRRLLRKTLLLAAGALFSCAVAAQNLPRLELLRPIYVIGGVPLSEKPTIDNYELSIQISTALVLFDNFANTGFQFLMGYTQLSIWDFWAYSHPFYEYSFMPALYFRKHWDVDSGRKAVDFGYEHRSNGRADPLSRSINYLFLCYFREYKNGFGWKANLRPGFGVYGDTFTVDMPLRYTGFFDMGLYYEPESNPWSFHLDVTPIYNKSIANVTAGVAYTILKGKPDLDAYLQFHYGYDDALRDCINEHGQILTPEGRSPYVPGEPLPPRSYIRFGLRLNIRHQYIP